METLSLDTIESTCLPVRRAVSTQCRRVTSKYTVISRETQESLTLNYTAAAAAAVGERTVAIGHLHQRSHGQLAALFSLAPKSVCFLETERERENNLLNSPLTVQVHAASSGQEEEEEAHTGANHLCGLQSL